MAAVVDDDDDCLWTAQQNNSHFPSARRSQYHYPCRHLRVGTIFRWSLTFDAHCCCNNVLPLTKTTVVMLAFLSS